MRAVLGICGGSCRREGKGKWLGNKMNKYLNLKKKNKRSDGDNLRNRILKSSLAVGRDFLEIWAWKTFLRILMIYYQLLTVTAWVGGGVIQQVFYPVWTMIKVEVFLWLLWNLFYTQLVWDRPLKKGLLILIFSAFVILLSRQASSVK